MSLFSNTRARKGFRDVCEKRVLIVVRKKMLAPPGSWARCYKIYRARGEEELRVSPNGMCVVGLSPTHEAFSRGIAKVTFNEELHVDFSGKKKKGAMNLEPSTIICSIACEDGTTFDVLR